MPHVIYKLVLYNLVPENGDATTELEVYNFKGPGVALAMYNVDEVCFILYFQRVFSNMFNRSFLLFVCISTLAFLMGSPFEHLPNHQWRWLLQRNGLFT